MKQEIIIRKQEDFKVSQWSGGDTTELYLYPEEGSYKGGDFMVRISSATVETEKSDFTSLPGVKRYLMIFQGHLDMIHGQEKKVSLEPYEVDEFDGGVPTTSFGQVVDFNLMLKNKARGKMEALCLEPGEEREICPQPGENFLAVYVKEGQAVVQGKTVQENQLALLFGWEDKVRIENPGETESKMGVCRVGLPV